MDRVYFKINSAVFLELLSWCLGKIDLWVSLPMHFYLITILEMTQMFCQFLSLKNYLARKYFSVLYTIILSICLLICLFFSFPSTNINCVLLSYRLRFVLTGFSFVSFPWFSGIISPSLLQLWIWCNIACLHASLCME